MADSKFKQKFDKLLSEMTDLAANAQEEDLRNAKVDLIKINPESSLHFQSEEEFDLNMMYKISGKMGEMPYILIDHDQLSDDSVDAHYDLSKKQGRPFIIPSIISTELQSKKISPPYLLFFSRDGRLFMYPVEGSGFSDTGETEHN